MDRGRAAQPSRAQVEVLLEHLERHPDIAKGFAKVPSAREACRRSWESLSLRLNSLGGCIKTWQQWSKYWSDKKNFIKKKAVLRHRAQHGTGGGDRVVELTELEERMLAIMGGEQFAIGNSELRTSLFTTATGPTSPPPNSDTLPPSPTPVHLQPTPLPSTSTESPSLLLGMDILSTPPLPPTQFQDVPAVPDNQSTPSQLDDDTTGILPGVSTPPPATTSLSRQISPSASGAHPSQTTQPRQQRNVRRSLTAPRGRFPQFPTPSRRRRQLSPPSQRPTQYSLVSQRFLSLEEGRIELDRQRMEVDRQRVEADRQRVEAYRERAQAEREASHARTQAYRERTEVHRQRLDFERQYAREKIELERRKSTRGEYDSEY